MIVITGRDSLCQLTGIEQLQSSNSLIAITGELAKRFVNYYMENPEIICQSCGMPIVTAEDCGSDSLGSRSFEYCYHCYSGGKFTDEGISVEERIEQSVKAAVAKGIPEEKARKMATLVIPQLSRWHKKDHYPVR